MNSVDQVREKIAALESALTSAHPQIPVLLKEILVKLKEDPDVVTVFSEEEIGVLVSGMKRQTQVVISTSKTKSSSTAKKGTALNIGLDL